MVASCSSIPLTSMATRAPTYDDAFTIADVNQDGRKDIVALTFRSAYVAINHSQ